MRAGPLLVAALLAGAGALAAQRGRPGRMAPPRLGVRILGYRFAIELADTGGAIRALARVTLARPVPGRADTLPLDLVGLAVDSVRDSSGGRLQFVHDGRVLRIVLPPARRAGALALDVAYGGSPSDGLVVGRSARGRRGAFADNWPDRARHFLPTVDHPAFKAPVTWVVTAPGGLTVVANGRLERVEDLAGGRRRWTYVERRPIPTYTMVLGAAPFSVGRPRPAVVGVDTTPIELWTDPVDSAWADSVPFRRAAAAVEALARLVGPFPYDRLAHVQSATRYGGMENSSAIFYAEDGFVARRMGEGVVRHETAHQWFGDAVTPRDWRHLWLSEGFATYFDAVLAEALGDEGALARAIRHTAEGYLRSGVVGRPLVDSAASDPAALLDANSYNKGALVLHMLRAEVGDSAFFRGVRAYYRAWRDSSVLSEDFQRAVERAARRDLGWFFRQWLYRPGHPMLDVEASLDGAAGRVALVVRQVQPDAWGAFRLPRVTVRFSVPGGEPIERTISIGAEPGGRTHSFDLGRPVDGVAVDPDGLLLLTASVRSIR